MKAEESYIKKHLMGKVAETLVGLNDVGLLENQNGRAFITYLPKSTHLIKHIYTRGQVGSMVETKRVTYEEFNSSMASSDTLTVNSLPLECDKVVETGSRYVYYSTFGTPLSRVFQRYEFKVGDKVQVEALAGETYCREFLTIEFDTDKSISNLLDLRIYVDQDESKRCKGLEDRGKLIASQLPRTSDNMWLVQLSYWLQTVRHSEPGLLEHIRSGESLASYTGV